MSGKKVYNPFKKAYWTKDNLLGTEEEREKLSQAMKDAKVAAAESKAKSDNVSKKLSGIGWKLTLMITVPLLLTIFLGVIGFVIGAVIFIITLVSMFKKNNVKQSV